jgi:hypothetical protein
MCEQCRVQFHKTCVDCGESVNREHKRCRACHELRQERIAKWQEANELKRQAARLEEMARKNNDQVEAMRQRHNAARFRERADRAMARREELIPHIRWIGTAKTANGVGEKLARPDVVFQRRVLQEYEGTAGYFPRLDTRSTMAVLLRRSAVFTRMNLPVFASRPRL